MMSTPGRCIDAIGDVHGSLEQLRALLAKLGYFESAGRWQGPEGHGLVFLGDYVDKGPHPYESYRLVRTLCEQGLALAILGNHDTNAIQFSARRAERTISPRDAMRAALAAHHDGALPEGGWLRDHARRSESGRLTNIVTHEDTLRRMNAEQYEEFIGWVRRLPAWIEISGRIRFVHAAWIDAAIRELDAWSAAGGAEPRVAGATALPSLGIVAPDFAHASQALRSRLDAPTPYTDRQWCDLVDIGEGRKDACNHKVTEAVAIALERLTKGIELPFPDKVAILDVSGIERENFRARWYHAPKDIPIESLALMRRQTVESIPAPVRSRSVPEKDLSPAHDGVAYPLDAPPVLFGHYGLAPSDFERGFHPKCACLDYSGFHDGELYAYRWRGEAEFARENFVSVPGAGREIPH